MNLTYSSVRDPRWAAPDHSAIDCIVKFDHLKQEVKFTANPKDSMQHGREIFERCATGKYGSIGEFQPATGRTSLSSPESVSQSQVFQQWPEMCDFLNEANRENDSGTVRGQVLIWSSMIELLIG
jgi:hypothetical protein